MSRGRMWSTSKETADRNATFISFRRSRRISAETVHIFTDGSSSGWHAAVVLIDGKKVRRASRFLEPGPMRNVAAELRALTLGLYYAPKGRECVVVHDYLGVGAWYIGAWQIKKPEVQKLVDESRRVALARDLTLSFIHHGGHQSESRDDDFTYWNNEVDRLCSPDRRRLGHERFYDK